jgi:phosphatidate cytidylyltransferase
VKPEVHWGFIVVLIAAVGVAAFGSPAAALVLLGCGAAVLWWIRSGDPWLAGGVFYLGLPCVCLVWLRGDPEFGRVWVFWLLAIVWSSDVGAYLTGSLIGGPRLAPRISPKKTWSGFAGGLVFACLAGAIMTSALGLSDFFGISVASVAVGLCAQVGDLFESWVKRAFGVKDSGALIPGHGGLLDRIDALMVASAATALIAALSQGRIWTWP